jgi:hypothetical protein
MATVTINSISVKADLLGEQLRVACGEILAGKTGDLACFRPDNCRLKAVNRARDDERFM